MAIKTVHRTHCFSCRTLIEVHELPTRLKCPWCGFELLVIKNTARLEPEFKGDGKLKLKTAPKRRGVSGDPMLS